MKKTGRIPVSALLLLVATGCAKHHTVPVQDGPEKVVTLAPTTPSTPSDADAAAAERARLEAEEQAGLDEEQNRVRSELLEPVYFEFDASEITDFFLEKLERKADILKANPAIRLRVDGHTDSRGHNEYNLALGQRRAASVRDVLLSYGVPKSQLAVMSFGEERPAVTPAGDNDEKAHAMNRRAAFTVIATNEGSDEENAGIQLKKIH